MAKRKIDQLLDGIWGAVNTFDQMSAYHGMPQDEYVRKQRKEFVGLFSKLSGKSTRDTIKMIKKEGGDRANYLEVLNLAVKGARRNRKIKETWGRRIDNAENN